MGGKGKGREGKGVKGVKAKERKNLGVYVYLGIEWNGIMIQP